MSLRAKIVLLVTTVVVLYAVADHLLQRAMLLPRFAELEQAEARQDIERAVEAIRAEIGYLDQACRDRASWDETYAFVEGEDPDARARFVTSNLSPGSMAQDRIDLLYLCDRQGDVLWGDVRDWRSGQTLTLRDLPRERLAPSHAYLVTKNVPRSHEAGAQRGYVSGLVLTEHGPMLIAARPVLPSDGEGAVRGTLILGRFLNDALVADLARRTSVDIATWPLDSSALPPQEVEALPLVTSTVEPVLLERGHRHLDVYTTVPDLRRAPTLLVRARVPRGIWAQGRVAVRYAMVSTIAAGLLLLLLLLGMLQRTVLSPIARLTAHAVYIGKTEDSTAGLGIARSRRDEIGVLAGEFDAMLDKLARSRAAVVDTARKAGMSDIANGILHNVGNVLNSVNVSAGLVTERLRSSKVDRLERLSDLAEEQGDRLGEFISQDPRGRHFGAYLIELARSMRAVQEDLEQEVTTLNDGVEHIRRLVSSQQVFAGRSGLRETTTVADELENALRIGEQATESLLPVEVEWQLEDLPAQRIDRHKLMEILVNVIKNAHEAMGRAEGPRRLRAAARRLPGPDGGERLELELADSGPGIAPDDLTRVFNHGFTTKPDGHGFGLHAAANAAKELGGTLVARSPGPLGGASFVLEIPFLPAAEPVQASRGAA